MRNDTTLATLAGAALAVGVPVTLRQLDVIERLPDLPWRRWFDANKVTTSPEAYPIAGIPDGLAACLLYMTEAGLALARRRRPNKKACVYCLSNIALNFAMVPFAWRLVRGRSR